jgi:hypothetical protein
MIRELFHFPLLNAIKNIMDGTEYEAMTIECYYP